MTMNSKGNGRCANQANGTDGHRPDLINPNVPHVALTQVFERVNRHGRRYLVGRLGGAKLIIVPTNEVSRGEPVWKVFLGEGQYASECSVTLAQGLDDAAATSAR